MQVKLYEMSIDDRPEWQNCRRLNHLSNSRLDRTTLPIENEANFNVRILLPEYGRPLPPKIQHVWNELTLSEMIHYILKWFKNTQINELTQ